MSRAAPGLASDPLASARGTPLGAPAGDQGCSPGVLRYFHPVLPARALRQGPVRVEIAGRSYALFRDGAGRPAALDDLCPHRRAPLSRGRVRPDGRLACPYHGWNFDAEGHGRSPSCPELTNCNTRAYQVVERYGFLWLAERSTRLTSFPALGWEGFDFAGTVSTLFRGPLDLTLDNVTEDEHFAFIHSTFGWDEAGACDVSVETVRSNRHTEVRIAGPQRASIWALLGGLRRGDRFHNEWTTHFDPVRTIYTFGWRDPRSGTERPVLTRAAVFLVPETAAVTATHMFLFLRIAPSPQRRLRRAVHWMARHIARRELECDARFIPHVAAAPSTLRGMRLTRFDQALAHNRGLLRDIYWGTGDSE